MRSKEEELDYRYLADPVIAAISIPNSEIERLRNAMPKLAHIYREEFMQQLGLGPYDADILTRDKGLVTFYSESLKLMSESKKVANWLITDVLARCQNYKVLITPAQFIDIIKLTDSKKISKKNALDLLDAIWGTDIPAEKKAKDMGIMGSVAQDQIKQIINDLIKQNQKAVTDYTTTPDKVVNFFMGQLMKATDGKADFVVAKKIVAEMLGEK